MREIVTLVCTKCGSRNYATTRNKRSSSLNIKKYCKFCHQHTSHKEK